MEALLQGQELEEQPHWLLKIYLGCKKWSNDKDRILPWTGGWLDWDFEETKGYEWLEELIEEEKTNMDRRQKAREAAKNFFAQ